MYALILGNKYVGLKALLAQILIVVISDNTIDHTLVNV